MKDSQTGSDTTKPVWKKPRKIGGHRMNELFNRFRQLVIELKGLTLKELSEKPQDQQLEEEILHDFIELEQKYRRRDDGTDI